MQREFFDAQNRPVRIGRRIGTGGEGDVHAVQGLRNQVAKIYHPSYAAPAAEKLRCMINGTTDRLLKVAAWPTSTLHEQSGTGPLAGFLMPKIIGAREIHTLYRPADRLTHFPDADWRFLATAALNCAVAFEEIHSQGFLVADVNQRNILVRKSAGIVIVDCDSFQVRTPTGRVFRSAVLTEEFTPPELQGRNVAGLDRTVVHDQFGLAVLIFHLLMMGCHPYSGVNFDNANIPTATAIRENRFAYTRNRQQARSSPPPYAPTLDTLPFSLAVLVERAFAPDAAARPSAAEWRLALSEFRDQLKPCSMARTHWFHLISTNCPWCELTQKHHAVYFTQPPLPQSPPSPPPPPPAQQTQVGPQAQVWPQAPLTNQTTQTPPNIALASCMFYAVLLLIGWGVWQWKTHRPQTTSQTVEPRVAYSRETGLQPPAQTADRELNSRLSRSSEDPNNVKRHAPAKSPNRLEPGLRSNGTNNQSDSSKPSAPRTPNGFLQPKAADLSAGRPMRGDSLASKGFGNQSSSRVNPARPRDPRSDYPVIIVPNPSPRYLEFLERHRGRR